MQKRMMSEREVPVLRSEKNEKSEYKYMDYMEVKTWSSPKVTARKATVISS